MTKNLNIQIHSFQFIKICTSWVKSDTKSGFDPKNEVRTQYQTCPDPNMDMHTYSNRNNLFVYQHAHCW